MATTDLRPEPDRPHVPAEKPGRRAEARYLGEVLELVAFTAGAGGTGRYLLGADTYATAAHAVVAATLPSGGTDGPHAATAPAGGGARAAPPGQARAEREALRNVLAVLRRAVAGDPAAGDVLALVAGLGAEVCTPARTPSRVVADLERLVAALDPDPAGPRASVDASRRPDHAPPSPRADDPW